MHTLTAILIGKLISKLSKTFNLGGGSAAPGLYALKIDPNLVTKLTSKIPKNVVITGTNGKTTTSRIIAHFAKESNLKIIRNHTGSNLERGIASTLISHFSLFTFHPSLTRLAFGGFSIGIWELDEAAFNSVTPKIKPDIVVFLNVFRDQLDRYGEIDTVLKNWQKTLQDLSKDTIVLLNGDDHNLRKLKNSFKGKVYLFGVKDYKIIGESISHIKEQENLDFEAKDVKLNGLNGSSFQLTMNDKRLTINSPLPGIYHIYDTLAAMACAYLLNLEISQLSNYLINFSPAFGRVEKLDFGYIFLIKNPAGATQVFETLAPNFKKDDRLLIALNDNLADGTDVSWIWDGEFERLHTPSLRDHEVAKQSIFVSGTRAYDLANRLKYAGFDPKNIKVEPDLKKALEQAKTGLKGQLYILPTYTAMLELQGILAKQGLKKNYWEEESD